MTPREIAYEIGDRICGWFPDAERIDSNDAGRLIEQAITQALAEQIDRDAKIAEAFGKTRKNHGGSEWDHGMALWANEIAAAIRAQGIGK